MSYRDDLKKIREERKQVNKTVFKTVKITICAFAACIFITAVLLVLDFATKGELSNLPSGSTADRKPPVISLKSGDAIYMYVGENIAFKSAVEVSDNSGSYTLDVNSSNLKKDTVGTYEIIYTATDAAGNSVKLNVTVVVLKKEYSKSVLMDNIKAEAAKLGISDSMTKQEKVRKIYSFVNSRDTIEFTNESNIPSIDRDNWRTDWVEEAARTLESRQGDCYSYYSLSKAFFEYFGIENEGIQRDYISEEAGTHFWSVVNIGTKDSPKWYYYDSTRLGGKFADGTKDACLITLQKLQSYTPNQNLGYDFYEFNPKDYPTVSTETLK